MARFNHLVTNRVARPLARRLPGFGVVVHIGRKSHRLYRTPVNVFKTPDGYIIALTYGRESDWVQNVLAAGSCDLIVRGRLHRLRSPRIIHDETRALAPRVTRPLLKLMRVTDFLHLAMV
jgi:deazaflavin-dependent oxidoreductase (nitroreductase family)